MIGNGVIGCSGGVSILFMADVGFTRANLCCFSARYFFIIVILQETSVVSGTNRPLNRRARIFQTADVRGIYCLGLETSWCGGWCKVNWRDGGLQLHNHIVSLRAS